MIDWHKLINKYAQDEGAAMDNAERQRKYLERQKESPTEAFINRQQIKNDVTRSLKDAGTIEGLAFMLGTQLANIKNDLRKKIVRSGLEPASQEIFLAFQKDATEMYYLRGKLQEFAKTLQFDEPGAPLVPQHINDLVAIKELLHNSIQRFGHKYKSIGATMHKIQTKLNEL